MNWHFNRQQFAFVVITVSLSVIVGIFVARVYLKSVGTAPQTQDRLSQKQVQVVSEESVVIDVVKKASPAVASIAIERKVFEPFSAFGPRNRDQESGIGTGFVIRENGLVLTNKHVVEEKGRYFVLLRDQSDKEAKYEVKQINKDPFNDLAILKIEASGLRVLELGSSSELQVGQKVIAIGNALGRLSNTVTTGIISGLGRGIAPIDPSTGIAERLSDVIQTDAAINPGNSGGPLLNTSAQVIGVNTAVAGAENIGFAIPVNAAKELVFDFEKTGRISRPFLGVRYAHIASDVALLNNVPEGEFVREITPGSPAGKAGIQRGDIITHFDGKKLTESANLESVIRTKKVGDQVKITIWRDGRTSEFTITLGEAPQE